MSLVFLFHYLMLSMFRMLIHPSSGACDLFVELFNGLYCSGLMSVGVTLWFGWGGVVSGCLPYRACITNFDVLLTVHLSIFISLINQLDAQNFSFTISLFHASTCFEHTCSSPGGQNCITQPLVSSHL